MGESGAGKSSLLNIIGLIDRNYDGEYTLFGTPTNHLDTSKLAQWRNKRIGFVLQQVFTDRRGLQFMLGQIISNVIKYSTDNPMLTISTQHTTREIILSITDNGSGVKSYDLPYIFQKALPVIQQTIEIRRQEWDYI